MKTKILGILVILSLLVTSIFASAFVGAAGLGNTAFEKGDVNGDGSVNIADAVSLNDALGKRSVMKVNPRNMHFDFNENGVIDFQDVNSLLNYLFPVENSIEGDANMDGSFDISDVTFLRNFIYGDKVFVSMAADMDGNGILDMNDIDEMLIALFGSSDQVIKGDVNGDGSVNIADMVMLSNYFSDKRSFRDVDMSSADWDGNGRIEWKDLVDLSNHLFMNEDDLVLGDANDDGSVNIADAVSIIHYLNGRTGKIIDTQNADYNQDGIVDMSDSNDLLDYLFGNNSPEDPDDDDEVEEDEENDKESQGKRRVIYSRPPTRYVKG